MLVLSLHQDMQTTVSGTGIAFKRDWAVRDSCTAHTAARLSFVSFMPFLRSQGFLSLTRNPEHRNTEASKLKIVGKAHQRGIRITKRGSHVRLVNPTELCCDGMGCPRRG